MLIAIGHKERSYELYLPAIAMRRHLQAGALSYELKH